jgi:hypothetical protein
MEVILNNFDYNDYSSPDEDDNFSFNINEKIIDNNDDGSYLIKLSARELIYYITHWCFNREINDDRVEELYQNYKSSKINPLWIFHIIYDNKSNPNYKLFLLDGQHRREVIRRILEDDFEMKFKKNFYCIVYAIDFCETQNKKKSIELFKKINNNKQFKEEDLPDDFVTDIVNALLHDNVLKFGIKKNDKNEKAQEPSIHIKQLNNLLNHNLNRFKHLSTDEIVKNLKIINNILSLKEYKILFGNKSQKKEEIHNKAKIRNFYLNLKSSKYPPDYWINFIDNPRDL